MGQIAQDMAARAPEQAWVNGGAVDWSQFPRSRKARHVLQKSKILGVDMDKHDVCALATRISEYLQVQEDQ